MMQIERERWLALALGALLALACGGDSDSDSVVPEPDSDSSGAASAPLTPEQREAEGLDLCCELGAVCHPGPDDPIGGLVYNCHQLGHSNDPSLCSAQFDECIAGCLGDREAVGAGEHGCI